MIGLDEASNPAKEFGALSFFIGLRVGRLRGGKIGQIAFGPDQRADGLGPALGEHLVELLLRGCRPQPRPIDAAPKIWPIVTQKSLRRAWCPIEVWPNSGQGNADRGPSYPCFFEPSARIRQAFRKNNPTEPVRA